MDGTLTVEHGRVIGYHDFGAADGVPVLWCHGGPGSRLEPAWLAADAVAAQLRIVGIDRPAYGRSTPRPGRTITDGVADVLRVADALGLARFLAVGVSTGGAYALAAAALAPDRLIGVLAVGALTDMAWAPGRATMDGPHVQAVWDAPGRDLALVAATDAYGEGFSKLLDGGMAGVLTESDAALFSDPNWMGPAMDGFPAMSEFGMEGYVDDRIADGGGWVGFDPAAIVCPVTVLHGDGDHLAAVIQAEHTAQIVPGAELVVVPGAGHFSIERHVVSELGRLLGR